MREAQPRELGLRTVSECACDCCAVVPRAPDEMETLAAAWKCSTDATKSECAADGVCSDPWDQLLTSSSADAMSTERFCAMSCRPFDDALGGACVPLDRKETAAVMTRDGNSDDPQLPPELPTITGAPKGASPHAAAAETADLPCEERRPCVYDLMDEYEAKARDAYKNVTAVAAAVRDLQ